MPFCILALFAEEKFWEIGYICQVATSKLGFHVCGSSEYSILSLKKLFLSNIFEILWSLALFFQWPCMYCKIFNQEYSRVVWLGMEKVVEFNSVAKEINYIFTSKCWPPFHLEMLGSKWSILKSFITPAMNSRGLVKIIV